MGICMRRAELVRRGSCGDAGDGVRGQQERSVEVAKPHHKGRWRGTWLLSKFREQRGVFRARATTVDIADHGCAWEEPEPLAEKLPTSLMTFNLSRPFCSFCASGGGGVWHGIGQRDAKRRAWQARWFIKDVWHHRSGSTWRASWLQAGSMQSAVAAELRVGRAP